MNFMQIKTQYDNCLLKAWIMVWSVISPDDLRKNVWTYRRQALDPLIETKVMIGLVDLKLSLEMACI